MPSWDKFWTRHRDQRTQLPLLNLLFSCSVVSDSATPWTAAHQAPLSFTISQSLLKLMSTELVMLSNHLILCRPLLILPSIFPSISVFSNELALHIRYQSIGASTSVLPMNTQIQHHNLKASILRHLAFFVVQLSHLSMTTGKTIALTIWTFVSKVMSLLFNTLSRFSISFLPRSKCLLISWHRTSQE